MKQTLTKQIMTIEAAERIWQPGFFDHVMRSSESYSGKWFYVQRNPVRAGLVQDVNEWKYAGELDVIHF